MSKFNFNVKLISNGSTNINLNSTALTFLLAKTYEIVQINLKKKMYNTKMDKKIQWDKCVIRPAGAAVEWQRASLSLLVRRGSEPIERRGEARCLSAVLPPLTESWLSESLASLSFWPSNFDQRIFGFRYFLPPNKDMEPVFVMSAFR